MQIILVHPRFKQAVNLHVSLRLVTIAGCLLVLTMVAALTGAMLSLASIDPMAALGFASAGNASSRPGEVASAPAAIRDGRRAHAPAAVVAGADGRRSAPTGRATSDAAVHHRSAGQQAVFGAASAQRTSLAQPRVASSALARASGADALHRPNNDRVLRDSIDALAVRVGQLQAELTRLEAIGKRVAGMAGLDLSSISVEASGQGGPMPSASRALTVEDLSELLDTMQGDIDRHANTLSLAETLLIEQTIRSKLVPSEVPLEQGFVGSGFGRRIDPFTGRATVHEGIDFNAPRGTPILAAAGGVVVFAGRRSGYGKVVDIDHGQGLTTRYAHASRLLVKVGDIVKQGQHIAAVGSTGRSTGPHLHFEVLVEGKAQNPLKFLADGLQLKRGTPLAAN